MRFLAVISILALGCGPVDELGPALAFDEPVTGFEAEIFNYSETTSLHCLRGELGWVEIPHRQPDEERYHSLRIVQFDRDADTIDCTWGTNIGRVAVEVRPARRTATTDGRQ